MTEKLIRGFRGGLIRTRGDPAEAGPRITVSRERKTMTKLFEREIDQLRRRILELGEVVKASVGDAIRAVERRDSALAERVIDGDRRVDEMEVEIEEECLKILALHQPVAMDLRLVVAALKMNNDLERIGDKAAGLAKRARRLTAENHPGIEIDLHRLAERVLAMLTKSLDALFSLDRDLAKWVCEEENEVNRLDDRNQEALRRHAAEHPECAEAVGLLIEVSSGLERIADLATNIAEDVLYMIDGAIVRHIHEG